jgi:parvulin-like peptidyl-prolyl isomerase
MPVDTAAYAARLDAALAELQQQPIQQLLQEHGILKAVAREQLLRQLQAEPPDLEARYGSQVEAFFLQRRAALEQVVFGLIRLQQLSTAEELYLRLSDDGADFGELASRFSLGNERLSRGLVGPMAVGQLHPRLAAALAQLQPGELHPPLQLDPHLLLLRLEHREPARLDGPLRAQLLQEMLQGEVASTVEAQLERLAARG